MPNRLGSPRGVWSWLPVRVASEEVAGFGEAPAKPRFRWGGSSASTGHEPEYRAYDE